MDNTLLQSSINFKAMKEEVVAYLVSNELIPNDLPVQEHTTSTLIEYMRKQGISAELDRELMDIAVKHELIGMEGAGLEQGVTELLNLLHHQYKLAVVTNNAHEAALKALAETGIAHYFDMIVGREQMTSMKPSPSGFLFVMEEFPYIASHEWLSIGDSWIDGRASIDAGIAFISYGTSMEMMRSRGVEPIGQVDEIMDLLQFLK